MYLQIFVKDPHQLLQSLQHLLHLRLGAVALHLQPAEFSLDLVPVAFRGCQELEGGRERGDRGTFS